MVVVYFEVHRIVDP